MLNAFALDPTEAARLVQDYTELSRLAGVTLSPDAVSMIVALLRTNAPPSAIVRLLRLIAVTQ
eukprot:m.13008 g.13008  ORF g.13008 m.13008 type:complete len:63 (+) comp10078_c0_seq2:257-445(+)